LNSPNFFATRCSSKSGSMYVAYLEPTISWSPVKPRVALCSCAQLNLTLQNLRTNSNTAVPVFVVWCLIAHNIRHAT
jgi:hypothetical protein